MCLIVEKKPADVIDYNALKRWMSVNADGWGIMLPDSDGGVEVVKGMSLKGLWREIRQRGATGYYIHLRMATHGDVREDNTHPYEVTRGIWLMHNGILDIDTLSAKERSDTWHWIDRVLRPLLDTVPDASAAIRSDWFKAMVELYGGRSNRFVFMDARGAVTMNNSAWHTFADGLRVSNTYALGQQTWMPGKLSALADMHKPVSVQASFDNWVKEDYKRTWKDDLEYDRMEARGKAFASEDDEDGYSQDTLDHAEDVEDDFRALIGLDYDDCEQFTYSYPDRAAKVLHYLCGEDGNK